MLRVIARNSPIIKKHSTLAKPVLCRSLRYNSSTSYDTDYGHKVYALPFKLPEEKVHQIVNFASYVNNHGFLGIFEVIKSVFRQKLPDVKESLSSMQVRKAYLPFWYYDIAMSADITPCSTNENVSAEEMVKMMGPARQMLGVGFDCYWPGHTWDPVCYLSFGQSSVTRMETLVPFTPELYENKEDIEIVPFTVNPLKDISERAPSVLENLQINSISKKYGNYTMNNAEVLFNAAYPIYWPVYIAQFTGGSNSKSEEPPKTLVIGAHNDNPPLYQWNPTKTGVDQWVNNGPWFKLDVTEQTWQMGFGNQTILNQLVQRCLTNVVGQFQISDVNWEDARVQAYPKYEAQNKDYLKQLFKVWSERSMLTRIEGVDENKRTIGIGKNGSDKKHTPHIQVKKVSEIRKQIENNVGKDLKKLEELEPVWFKEYKNKQ